MRYQAVADRKFHEHVSSGRDGHVVPHHANDDAAKHVDDRDDNPGNRVAADEFRGTVHCAEKRAFFFQLTAARLGLGFVDDPRGEIGVDGHLLAGDGVQRESGANLGDPGCALRNHQKIHGDQDRKHDNADEEIAAHDEVREARDHVAGRRDAFGAARKDQARGGDVQREAKQRRNKQNRWECREIERTLNPKRNHEDQDGERN